MADSARPSLRLRREDHRRRRPGRVAGAGQRAAGVILGSVEVLACAWSSERGEYDWLLAQPRPVPEPLSARGFPKRWEPEPDVIRQIRLRC